MKLYNLMMLFIAIQLSVVIFNQHMIYTDTPAIGNQFIGTNYSNMSPTNSFYTVANQTDLGTNTSGTGFPNLEQYNSFTVWALADFFFSGLSANTFIMFIMLLLVYVFTFGLFASRNEMVYLSPLAMILLGVAFLPLYNLNLIISSELTPIICGSINNYCWLAAIFSYIIVIPLAFLWVFSVIEFWSARSMG